MTVDVTGAGAEVTGAVAELTVDVTGAGAELTGDVTGAGAEVTGAVAELTGDVTGAAAEVTGAGAGAGATVAVADVAGVVVDVAVEVAALVTGVLVADAEVAEVTADVTGAVAVATVEVTVDVTEPEPVVGPGTAATAGPVALLGLEPGADDAEVADAMAEVTFDVGKVAACACREDSRRRTRIPAAAIATCTTRRAMRRTIGCGIATPELAGTGQTRLLLPHHQGPKPLPGGLFLIDLGVVITCRELPKNNQLIGPVY